MEVKQTSGAIETERSARIEKVKLLQQKGINPYAVSGDRDMNLQSVKDQFNTLEKTSITLSGRIKSLRLSGKIGFATMEDESCPEGFQFIWKQDILSNSGLSFDDFKQLIDKGDYIQATGTLERSQRGEPSLFVHHFTILTKALRSLPDKLDDIEQKYRKRYIDMKLHPDVREMFRMKSRFWRAARDYMIKEGFLEVYAPTMEHTTGGAEAEPFSTHHNALDEDYYLRISSELYLKRYIVGGFEKVFDIDKNFRNEGIDDEHLQEYYQMEFYWSYAGFDQLLSFSEGLIKHIIQETFGTLELIRQGEKVNWKNVWPRMSYYEFIEHFAGIDLKQYQTAPQLRSLADDLGLSYSPTDGYGRLLDLIYKKTARPRCISPVWLTDHPVTISPLAKRNPKNPELTLRTQLIAYGSELCNGFAELNDPIDQLERFQEQQNLRELGDHEAMMLDHDFIEALEYGMPPTCGLGFSERLFSVLMQKSIRETTAFPMVKRKEKKTIVICGAMSFRTEFITAQELLRSKGIEVMIPDLEVDFDNERLTQEELMERKGELMRNYLKNISKADIILIWNKAKNGVPGYIGGNTLLEMGCAFNYNKPIFLLEPIPEMFYKDEIMAMSPQVLYGDLNKLPI